VLTEGSKAPYLAFIHKGNCTALRHITRLKVCCIARCIVQSPRQASASASKGSVAVGNLGPSQYFGAHSLLNSEVTEPYTLVATTPLTLLVIDPSDLASM
jgi:CRP-like cAMP-binding protein